MKQLQQQQMSLRRLQQQQLQLHSGRGSCGSHNSGGLSWSLSWSLRLSSATPFWHHCLHSNMCVTVLTQNSKCCNLTADHM